jgi:5-oxoprolinase (ATP-hydrolysing)
MTSRYRFPLPFAVISKLTSIVIVQVRGIGKTFDTLGESVYAEVSQLTPRPVDCKERADSVFSVYFDKVGRVDDTPVFLLGHLEVGDLVEGPAMIIDETQTIVVVPAAQALLTSKHLYISLE